MYLRQRAKLGKKLTLICFFPLVVIKKYVNNKEMYKVNPSNLLFQSNDRFFEYVETCK